MMELEETNKEAMASTPPEKVWGTLDAKQQIQVIQTIVNLCQQMIEVRKQEEKND